jgi:ABC-type nitrate/sulfonate/bicarbonate transport system substrate-binding protein
VDKVRIGIGVSSVGRFLPFVGEEAGLFEKVGISVEIVNQQDEEQVVVDIASGATPNAPSLLFALLEGNDLVIVGGILNRPSFYLTARPGIDGLADLKGKRIGINQPRRMAGVVMLALLRNWGLDPGTDLTLVELGINDKSFAALQQGKLDAALLPPEKAFEAEEAGCNLVADSLSLDCHWVPLATTRGFLKENPDLVRKVANIYRESVEIFKNQPELTLRVIERCLPGLAEKPQIVEKVYQLFASEFEPTLTPSTKSLRAILDEIAYQDPKAANLLVDSLTENVF